MPDLMHDFGFGIRAKSDKPSPKSRAVEYVKQKWAA
jgi:hypothetical protein